MTNLPMPLGPHTTASEPDVPWTPVTSSDQKSFKVWLGIPAGVTGFFLLLFNMSGAQVGAIGPLINSSAAVLGIIWQIWVVMSHMKATSSQCVHVTKGRIDDNQ